jgi:alkyl hydroperoxide reductase subunit AhpC
MLIQQMVVDIIILSVQSSLTHTNWKVWIEGQKGSSCASYVVFLFFIHKFYAIIK